MAAALQKALAFIGFGSEPGYEQEEEILEDQYEAPVEDLFEPVEEPEYDLTRIVNQRPATFNDVATIGAEFRQNVPVFINLEKLRPEEARRVVDFASGLVYGLRGSIEKITDDVYLLSPQNVRVESATD